MATSVEPEVSTPPRTARLCLGCNYSLNGLPANRCPECGREFDPADPNSFTYRPLGSWHHKMLQPIGWPTFTAIGAICAWYLYVTLDPGIHYFGVHIMLGLLLFIPIALVLIVRHQLRLRPPGRPLITTIDRRRSRVALAIFGITFLLVIFHIPMRIMFLFAKPELDHVVAGIIDGSISQPVSSHRAGPIVISSNRWYGDDDQYFFDIHGLSGGFAYCRTPGRPLYYNTGVDGHLWGNWYWWHDD